MRVMILGAKGQLGSDLVGALADWEVLPLTRADLDLCDFDKTRAAVAGHRPDAVINTAAFHRVEECEDRPETAFQVNALAARNLAHACALAGTALLHLSTDYVFDGEARDPYPETAPANPVNVYGASKLAGEHLVRQATPRHFIVRTSGLYGLAGASGKGGNFVELMVRLAREGKPIRVVTDQVLTPTYTADLALAICEILRTDAFGVYHVSSGGGCSWFEFAGRIFRLLKLTPDFTPTTSAAFGAKVKRPAYSVLAHEALARLAAPPMRPWEEALEAYLRAKGHLTASRSRAA